MDGHHSDTSKEWIRNHPVLTGLFTTLAFAIGVRMHAPSQQPDAWRRTPIGEFVLLGERSTTYCSPDGNSGRIIFTDDRDLREVSFKKSGDITHGDLIFRENKRLLSVEQKNAIYYLEGQHLGYVFDSYGVVNVFVVTNSGEISYGLRNFYGYLADPVNDIVRRCERAPREYSTPIHAPT